MTIETRLLAVDLLDHAKDDEVMMSIAESRARRILGKERRDNVPTLVAAAVSLLVEEGLVSFGTFERRGPPGREEPRWLPIGLRGAALERYISEAWEHSAKTADGSVGLGEVGWIISTREGRALASSEKQLLRWGQG